jgi:hydroxymethylglutaryl-CoA lyase
MPIKIKIVEIGPRDGFQSVKKFIPTNNKFRIIDKIVTAGIKYLQITSFVSPNSIPQMADAENVAAYCKYKYKNLVLSALVPNFRGAEIASRVGIKNVSVVISISEEHNHANVNQSVSESFEKLGLIKKSFPELDLCLDVATAFGCPFSGEVISYEQLNAHVKRGIDIGINKFCICDTTGIALPNQVRAYISGLIGTFPDSEFSVHIHDTRNMGILNTIIAIDCGITDIQVALGGLGGCPFAPGASGNTATEDLVYILNQSGYDTGIDYDRLLQAAKYEKQLVPTGNYSGHHINIA